MGSQLVEVREHATVEWRYLGLYQFRHREQVP